MEELKKELIVEELIQGYTVSGLVNAWSILQSPKVAGALIVPAIFVSKKKKGKLIYEQYSMYVINKYDA